MLVGCSGWLLRGDKLRKFAGKSSENISIEMCKLFSMFLLIELNFKEDVSKIK